MIIRYRKRRRANNKSDDTFENVLYVLKRVLNFKFDIVAYSGGFGHVSLLFLVTISESKTKEKKKIKNRKI